MNGHSQRVSGTTLPCCYTCPVGSPCAHPCCLLGLCCTSYSTTSEGRRQEQLPLGATRKGEIGGNKSCSTMQLTLAGGLSVRCLICAHLFAQVATHMISGLTLAVEACANACAAPFGSASVGPPSRMAVAKAAYTVRRFLAPPLLSRPFDLVISMVRCLVWEVEHECAHPSSAPAQERRNSLWPSESPKSGVSAKFGVAGRGGERGARAGGGRRG
jgi:hypothetical protein